MVNCSWSSKDSFKSTKSGDNWVVEIAKPLISLLRELRLKSASSGYVLPRLWKWEQGEQARILKFFLKYIGLPEVRFYDLRASWATQLLSKGVPPSKVMDTIMIYMRKAGIDIKNSLDSLDDMMVHKDYAKVLKIKFNDLVSFVAHHLVMENKKYSIPSKKEDCLSYWLFWISKLSTSLGNLLIGMAAIIGVCLAKEPVTNYLNSKVHVQQIVQIDTCKAKEQAEEIIQENNQQTIENRLKKYTTLPFGTSEPVGLYIRPKYVEPLAVEILNASDEAHKKELIEEAWSKSVREKTGSSVEFRTLGE